MYGVREVVGEAFPIPLFQIGDYKALAESLIKVYDKEFNLQHICDYSSNRYKYFTVEKLVDNYLRILGV